ncbi:MAG: TlpA family protein disulfide reductase [Bacteroidota bacterium]|nr:TlpA family protein disulfide reductase [Bacteroidota bacterium]
MKSTLFTLCFILTASLLKAQSGGLQFNQPAPAVNFQQYVGKQVPKDFNKGKILVIDFWATWCAPCIANFPHFNKLADTYQSKDVVFAILTEEKLATVQRFFDRTKKQVHGFNLVDTSKTTMNNFMVNYIPYSVVIDKNNMVKWAGSGEQLTDEILSKIIKNEYVAPVAKETPKPDAPVKKPVKARPFFSFSITYSDTTQKQSPGGSSLNSNGDYISVTKSDEQLGDLLEDLTGFGRRARIITNDTTKLKRRLTLDFDSRRDTTLFKKYRNTLLINKPRKNLIISLMGDALKFDAKINKVTKPHYELVVTDSAKLHSFMSMQKGHSSFSDDYFPKFEIVGYHLKDFTTTLEGSAKIIITDNISDDNSYDFSLDISNLKTIQQTLNFHGLGLKEVTGEVELLEVDFH